MNLKIQFTYEADVVVCGAGTAGAIAAIASANEGKKVALIEQFGAAGGSATLGLVTPLMHTGIEGNPMCSYISQKINGKLIEYGGASGDGSAFDPQMLSLVLEEFLAQDNIKIFYYTFICDVLRKEDSIEGIFVQNKSGRGIISGKVYIDATGDGDVAYLSGADFKSGDEETGKNQPVSLRYMLGGINIEKFREFLAKYGHISDNISTAMTIPNRNWPLYPIFMEAIENGDLVEDDAVYWQIFGVPGRKDTLAFNCPEFFDATDGVDFEDLTHVQLHGKMAIMRQLKFYKKYLPGFENAYISQIATMVGIRESRRIVTDYMLKADDILAHRKFVDGIVQSNYPIDIHGRKLRLEANVVDRSFEGNRPFYEIPYRSVVVKGIDNLLVAGRCIGADFVAQSSLRIMPTCRAMGEACGIAAAISIDNNIDLHKMDGSRVRKHMIKRGAEFADNI
ncbi:FAD-dependent oxidoreductase [Xylanivirga thermophila]|uniref:FAD-dependent oxidoreductase n=1 Tax=Xylanivirga thermophila TaxID=2496273 RepID=UPI00101D2566|nr:FAD-dependent oxidoreductase [Xylanivirga thermophila]